jgi:glycosyltransferase involved in cell wall biosynthesis
VQQYRCGFAIAPGDTDTLVDALQRMAREPDLVAAMGMRARQMLDARFSRRQGLERWQNLLDRLTQPQPV